MIHWLFLVSSEPWIAIEIVPAYYRAWCDKIEPLNVTDDNICSQVITPFYLLDRRERERATVIQFRTVRARAFEVQ